jgi:F-type H+-transporting ATPase subunit delta
VDESIIGGMIVRVGDKLIDASVKNQLQSIKEKLLAAKPK